MKDKVLMIEDVKTPKWGPSHTGLRIILYIDSSGEVVSLFEVDLQKPRNV